MGLKPLGIDHLVIRTVDHAAMMAFYQEVIGCTLERTQEAIGLYQLRCGTALIDLVPVDGKLGRMGGAAPGAEGRNMDHLCLRIADFNAARVRAHLGSHGVTVGEEGLRYGSTGEAISIYLADPDGNVLELRG
jgi:glyoxylase I family protein